MEPNWEWTWGRTVLNIILIPIVLGTIIENLLVLYTFLTRPRDLRHPSHYFIANLALADFLVGVLVIPFLATRQITNRWYFGHGFCSAWIVIHFWLCSSSILSTLAVCIERYIGVKFPLQHPSILTPKRIGGILAVVWIISGTLTLSSVLIWPEPASNKEFECQLNQQLGHIIVVTVGVFHVPATLMIIFYWQIYVIASRHITGFKKTPTATGFQLQIAHAHEQNRESPFTDNTKAPTEDLEKNAETKIASPNPNQESSKSKIEPDFDRKRQKQINLAKRLAIIVGVLLSSYTPFFTVLLIRAFNPSVVSATVFSTLVWIRYFNSCLNPFIYAYTVPSYRKFFTDIWGSLKSRIKC